MEIVVAAEIVEMEPVVEDEELVEPQPKQHPVIGGQSTLTFRLASGRGAPCTSGGGGALSFVLSPAPVRGRMCSLPSQLNEDPASPKIQ